MSFPPKSAGSTGRPEDQFQQFGYQASSQMLNPEAEALRIVKFEKTNWETAFAYVTEKVAFNMRSVIRQCRKNYWGVFDQATDPTTGREKIWEHLTKTFVDYVVATYDIDTKDIRFAAKHKDAIGFTSIVRSIVKNALDESSFGEQLKLALRQLAIDGTVVWNTEQGEAAIGYTESNPLTIRLVDLLNFYIDPTVDSIAEADSVIERIVVPLSEFQRLARLNKWRNQDILGIKNVSRYDAINNPGYNTQSDITFVELYRRRGLAKKMIITGNTSDVEYIPTEIICSGTAGNWYFHYAEERPDNRLKGYEEAWLTRVHGRWYGEGIAERLLQKQAHFNIISNIRINRSYLAQLGLFLVRKGSGITPQILSRLAANGAISVTNLETDIKQLPMDEASDASYKDEEALYQWAQRYTGASEMTIGMDVPASLPATNAAIQNQNAQTRFALIKDGIGLFLKRWLKHQALPKIFKSVTTKQLVKMHLDPDDLADFDAHYLVNPQIMEQLKQVNPMQTDPDQVMQEMERGNAKLRAQGMSRFVTLLHTIDITQYDIEPYVTNEQIDTPTLLQNYQQLLQTLAAIPGTDPQTIQNIVRSMMDYMGIDSATVKISSAPQMNPQMNPQAGMNQLNPTSQPGGNPRQLGQPQTPGQLAGPAMTREPR